MKYEIRHEETLVDYFDVYADSEKEALAEFDRLVSEGKIDFSNMEMITSSNTVLSEDGNYMISLNPGETK